jgi:hypothetical protein
VVYDAETTTHQEEAATLSVVYNAEKTTHTKVVTLSMVYDAETATQSCYTDHNSRTLRQNQPSLLHETTLLKQSE